MRAAAPPPSVDDAALQEAALSYLARYAATRAALRRVLDRRIARWAHGAAAQGLEPDAVSAACEAARTAAGAIVARLADAGAVDDAAFAEARARRLGRSGKSRRAIAAHLAAKGVDADTAAQALPAELEAALVFARRRRIGPFASVERDRLREMAAMARAGFAADTTRTVLALKREEALAMLEREGVR